MKKTHDARRILLAMSFADGCLDKYGSLLLAHSVAQKEYLEWKIRLLRSYGYKCSDISIRDNNSAYGKFQLCHARVSITPYSKLLRKILYPNGIKNKAQRRILDKFDLLHLAVWYMDDGAISQKKRNGVVTASELFLNTYLSKELNQVFIDYFFQKWAIKFGQVKDHGSYRLRCGTREARKLLFLIAPIVSQVPCMQYKLNVKSSPLSQESSTLKWAEAHGYKFDRNDFVDDIV